MCNVIFFVGAYGQAEAPVLVCQFLFTFEIEYHTFAYWYYFCTELVIALIWGFLQVFFQFVEFLQIIDILSNIEIFSVDSQFNFLNNHFLPMLCRIFGRLPSETLR